jgi:3'-phosphoadenosine 5'-phosphosulfate sulfotransferase (PAPS reductase)/FAD synthetase
MTPDLTQYDWIVINTSAGKDSLVMLDEIVRLATEAGVADRLVAVHADLGRVEWKGTRDLAERQVARYGVRFEVVSRPQGDLLDQIEKRGMWPSSSARYCTSDHKRGQIRKLFTQLTEEFRAGLITPRRCRILSCMGLRAEESPARAKAVAFEVSESASNGKREVTEWLPIHEWTTVEIWDHIHAQGLEYHYAYDLEGVTRLSCVMCVLAGDAQVKAGILHNPELAREYASLEDRIGHKFGAKRSIALMVKEVLG